MENGQISHPAPESASPATGESTQPSQIAHRPEPNRDVLTQPVMGHFALPNSHMRAYNNGFDAQANLSRPSPNPYDAPMQPARPYHNPTGAFQYPQQPYQYPQYHLQSTTGVPHMATHAAQYQKVPQPYYYPPPQANFAAPNGQYLAHSTLTSQQSNDTHTRANGQQSYPQNLVQKINSTEGSPGTASGFPANSTQAAPITIENKARRAPNHIPTARMAASNTKPVALHSPSVFHGLDKLPYDSASLTWNSDRTLNEQHKYCYCGEDRNLLDVDVQCSKCLNFIHGRCIMLDLGPVVPFLTNYQFICKHCNASGLETFVRMSSAWKNICATVMANLMLMRMRLENQAWDKSRYAAKNVQELSQYPGWYSRKPDMMPFLDVPRHWAAICIEKDKNELVGWPSTLGNALVANGDIFHAHDEVHRNANSMYMLANQNLFSFKSGYLSGVKSTLPRKRKVEDRDSAVPRPVQTVERAKSEDTNNKQEQVRIPPERLSAREKLVTKVEDAPAFTPRIPTIDKEPARPLSVVAKEIVRERKPPSKKPGPVKKADTAPTKLIRRPPPYKPQDFGAIPKAPGRAQVEGNFQGGPYYSMTDIPFNKRGFKYTLCEAAPHMPAIMYRQVEVEPFEARLDWSDMSQYMYLSRDAKSVTTDKGFRMGRANVVARTGQWYWEVKVLRGNGEAGGHVRLGVARREASLDGPIGFDGYSYGVRDKGGEKMHLSRPKPFMDGFGTGDVIGFHLSLPAAAAAAAAGAIARDRIPIRYRQQLYFEQFEYTASKEMEDLLNPGAVLPTAATTATTSSSSSSPQTAPATLADSFLDVYKNGRRVGRAFTELLSFWPPHCQTTRDQPATDDGTLGYYPAMSVYSGGAVRANFGPDFECIPEAGLLDSGVVQSMSRRYDEQVAEDVVYDLMDEVDLEQDLKDLSLGQQQQLEIEPIREIAEYD